MVETSGIQKIKDIISKRSVNSKEENYLLYESGFYGNSVRTWGSYEEIMRSGWQGRVCMRSKKGIARKKVRYHQLFAYASA